MPETQGAQITTSPVNVYCTWKELGAFPKPQCPEGGYGPRVYQFCEKIPFHNEALNPSVSQRQEASNSWSWMTKGLLEVVLNDRVKLD